MEKQLWRPLSLRERVRVRADYRNGPLPEPQALSGAPAPRTSPGGRGGPRRRRGATLVLVAVFLIPLTACVALAIDLGVLTFAQTQLADAADAAALAGADPQRLRRHELQLRQRHSQRADGGDGQYPLGRAADHQ